MDSKMIQLFLILLFSFFAESSLDAEYTVDLIETGPYTWEGLNSESTIIKIVAQNYKISVNIEQCYIGNPTSKPNNEYLILKNGDENPLSHDNGRIFAYIKKPKSIYFFSSSVILQLVTPNILSKDCSVTFDIGDIEDTTLPPVTTTEEVITYSPETSKYSTVLISGHSIEQYNKNKKLVQDLKDSIVAMGEEYTEVEGFCPLKKIKSEDVEIYTLEQCPTQWSDFENCVRLVYALPVKTNPSCTLWKGYQLTEEHLDLMWARLSSKYLSSGFSEYRQPEINSLVTWWMIGIILVILVFPAAALMINLLWRKVQLMKKTRDLNGDHYASDTKKNSLEISLSPPDFQPIPPWFGKIDRPDDKIGVNNEGYQYDALDNDDNGTTV